MTQPATRPVAPIVVAAFNRTVCGIDRRSGARVWTHELRSFDRIRLDVSDDRVIVLGQRLVYLDLWTGAERWSAALPMANADTLLCDRGQILVAGEGEVACYTEAGQLLWHDPFKGCGADRVTLAVPGRVSQADHGRS